MNKKKFTLLKSIHRDFHSFEIKNGIIIEKVFRSEIEKKDKKYQTYYSDKRVIMKDININKLIIYPKLTFFFTARFDAKFYNFPSNLGNKDVDVVTIGKDYIDLYSFKKGNGIKGSSNLDTTASWGIDLQLNLIKLSISKKCGINPLNIRTHIVIFTTDYPTWKQKEKNTTSEIISGRILCKRLGIPYTKIVNLSHTKAIEASDLLKYETSIKII